MRVQYITVHVINNYGLNQSLRRIITKTKEIDPKRTNPTSDESKSSGLLIRTFFDLLTHITHLLFC